LDIKINKSALNNLSGTKWAEEFELSSRLINGKNCLKLSETKSVKT